ncbi:MAG: hypothetical protein U9R06_00470 [Patescibacteria group bacterium]|nr:hypothetical protein [Patescibacteria group bacterium]
MKNKIIKLFLIGMLIAGLSAVQISMLSAADLQNAFGPGGVAEQVAGDGGYQTTGGEDLANTFIADIIKTALSFLGVIFLILIIYGGFIWMTARGNEQQAEKAKNILIAAVIGLIIVVLAYAISYLVIKKFTASALS